jgi:hypothetical protein
MAAVDLYWLPSARAGSWSGSTAARCAARADNKTQRGDERDTP